MFNFYTKRYIFRKVNYVKVQLIFLILSIFFIFIDQKIKITIINNLRLRESMLIVPGIIKATYLQNYGAAFNIMLKQRIFLILFTLVIIFFLMYYIINNKISDKLYLFSISMIVSGGIGNLIDRIFRGFVVDYINLIFWPLENFAVFNFADCLIVVGTFIFAINAFKQEIYKDNIKKNKRF